MIAVGPYDLIDEVGRGGFGVVFRAKKRETGEIVALKVVRSTVQAERLQRELRLLGDLGPDDGFVGLLDSGITPQGCYLVMPFLGGGTLRDRLHRGALGLDETLDLARSLARALGTAHARGIVHRDLKPENILYSEVGRVFVGDLGLAKHFRKDVDGASMSLSLSQGGGIRGTIGYAPPEQLRDAKEVGPEADVFALGAILYECLAGAPAFTGMTVLEVVERVESGSRESLGRARPDAPRALVQVVERCLERDPARRPADGGALLAALDAASAARRPAWLILLVPLAAALVVVGLGLGLAPKAAPPPPSAGPAPPPPPPPPPPATTKTVSPEEAARFSPLCAGFIRGEKEHLRLTQVIGDYDWRVAGEIYAVAFAPDGSTVLSAQGHHATGETQWDGMLDKTLALWDRGTGHELRRFKGHTSGVTGCGFLPDGTRAVSGSADGTIRLWDVATGAQLAVVPAGGPVLALAVARDAPVVAAGLADGQVVALDVGAGSAPFLLGRHKAACLTVAIGPNGDGVFSGGADRWAIVWDVAAARRGDMAKAAVKGIEVKSAVRTVAFTDPPLLLIGEESGVVQLRDALTGEQLALDAVSSLNVPVLAVARTRDTLLTAHRDGSLRETHPRDLIPLGQMDKRTAAIQAVAVSRDKMTIAWGGRDEAIALIGTEGTGLPVRHKAARVAVARAGGVERIATAGPDGSLRLWDGATGSALWTVKRTELPCLGVSFSPDGERIALVGEDGYLRVFNAATAALELSYDQRKGGTYRAVFSPGGETIVSCGDAGKIFAWPAYVGEARELVGHTKRVFAVAFCGDGSRVISGSEDRSIRIWDVKRGLELHVIKNAHTGLVGNIAVSPDGKLAISSSPDRSVKLWDTATGALVRELPKQPNLPWGIAFLDARRAIVSCYDGSIVVWDVKTGEKLDSVSLATSTDWSGTVVPTGDGKTFLAGTGRGVVLRFAWEE